MTDSSKKPITLEASLEGVSTLKDGGASVRLHTQELNDAEMALLMSYRNEFGWFLFAPGKISEADIPKETAKYDGKSPSQRLRAVLFVLWKQLTKESKTNVDFEKFYLEYINGVIDRIKEKLD